MPLSQDHIDKIRSMIILFENLSSEVYRERSWSITKSKGRREGEKLKDLAEKMNEATFQAIQAFNDYVEEAKKITE